MRIELRPGRPGRVRATFLDVDPSGRDVGYLWPADIDLAHGSYSRYITQPNHGINVAGSHVWTTNLLFGAPLEIDLEEFRASRVIASCVPEPGAPQISSTSHFAWDLDHRCAYFHQSLLRREQAGRPVEADDLRLLGLDTKSGDVRSWKLQPPPEDSERCSANFHSAFYFEENGARYVGLLRTGAVLESLDAHDSDEEHSVLPMPFSSIWTVRIDESQNSLQAELLPGLDALEGIALSHLEVSNSSGDGFVLFANYKQADVSEETHGPNVYSESPQEVAEHYSGAITQPLNFGTVIRYERRGGTSSLKTFSRSYDYGNASLGHSWLPINLGLDSTGERLFGSFAGFEPRLLPRHIAAAYERITPDYSQIRYVPSALIRFDSRDLKVDYDAARSHISYSEPMAFSMIAGEKGRDHVATFSPEIGLRLYRADDLTRMVAHAVSAELLTWGDSHFRPEPAHMVYLPA
ncbi:MAG: hypothetical protein GKS06_11200 [Acidobacteria bacterium]|nr:hypothetical protein [Acidobacteriota bacterium]